MRMFYADLARTAKPADLFVHFFSKETNAFWLDREFNQDSPFSIMGSGIEINCELSEISNILELDSTSNLIDAPFEWRPGLVGLIEYEGSAKFLKVDRALVIDHAQQRLHCIGLFLDDKEFESWCHAILLRAALVGGEALAFQKSTLTQEVTRVSLRHSPQDYLKMIEKAQIEIARGSIYQICLTNQITIQNTHNPLAVFLQLRLKNPAPYSAYFKLAKLEVVCTSPEQFIKVSPTGKVSSKPIKGTRARGVTPELDASAALELQQNEKERAENLMIVDLMRNDLGRVSESNSLKVSKLFEIESYSTVHQLVSTIEAKLAQGLNVYDAVSSAFPGGSMTGAPKIRAMQIIEELELGNRGVYSGAIGYIGTDGSADFGMTIRSLVFSEGVASIGVGGGITIDSDPMAELAETKLKAQALLAALNAPDPWHELVT